MDDPTMALDNFAEWQCTDGSAREQARKVARMHRHNRQRGVAEQLVACGLLPA
jgi:hypothetical protein